MIIDITMKRLVIIKIDSGNDLLEKLEKEINILNINNGIIVSGIGSLSGYHIHVVKMTTLPPGNVYLKQEGAFDLNSVNGYIINKKVHAHIVLSDSKNCFGGHLEVGTKVLTFCNITVIDASMDSLNGLDIFKGKII